MYKKWIRSGILFIGDIVGEHGFLGIDELKCKLLQRDGKWFSEYSKILAAIPIAWRQRIRNSEQSTNANFNLFRRKCISYSTVRLIEAAIHVKQLLMIAVSCFSLVKKHMVYHFQ